VDGEREDEQWTVVISGVSLGEGFVRMDGDSLDYCLTKPLTSLHEMLPELPASD
jgi:hypothetical protein